MIKNLIAMLLISLVTMGCTCPKDIPTKNEVNMGTSIMNKFTIVCNQYNVAYYIDNVNGDAATPVLKQDGDTIRYVSCDEIKVNKK
jgi:hypothetical protein